MFEQSIDQDLKLSLLRIEDASPLIGLIDSNRHHLEKWLPFVPYIRNGEDAKNFIENGLKQWNEDNGFHAGIWENGLLIGVIGFHYMDFRIMKTSLGYWLDQSHEGRGIITNACRAMIDHALLKRRLNRIVIKAPVANNKSRQIPERLGFTFEGILRSEERIGETFVDLSVYGLLKSEWYNCSFNNH